MAPRPFTPVADAARTGTLTFSKSVSVTETYTDNFRLAPDGTPKLSDFRTTVSGGLGVLINGARTQGSILASLGIVYDTVDSEDGGLKGTLLPAVVAAVQYEFTPNLSLSVTESFQRNDYAFSAGGLSTSGTGSVNSIGTSGLRRNTGTYYQNTTTVSLNWLADIYRTQLYYNLSYFSGENLAIRNDDLDSAILDSEDQTTIGHTLGANVTAPIGERSSGQVGYQLTLSDTTDSDQDQILGNLLYGTWTHRLGQFASAGLSGSYQLLSGTRSDFWNVSAFATYGLPTGVSFSGSVGYTGFMTGSTSGSFTSSVSAQYQFAKAYAAVGVNIGYQQTFLTGQDFGVTLTRSYYGAFGYVPTPFISTQVSVRYNQNELTGVGNTRSSDDLDYLTAQVSMTWQILTWLSLNASYSYNRYTGGFVATAPTVVAVPGGTVTQNIASLSLSGVF
jgi:hypothetical protein